MQGKSFHVYEALSEEQVETIINKLREIDGVKYAEGDVHTKIFVIQWSEPANWDEITNVLVRMGYSPAYR